MITLEEWKKHKVGKPLYVIGGGFEILWRVIAIEHNICDKFIAFSSGRGDVIEFSGRGTALLDNIFLDEDEANKIVKRCNKKILKGHDKKKPTSYWHGLPTDEEIRRQNENAD